MSLNLKTRITPGTAAPVPSPASGTSSMTIAGVMLTQAQLEALLLEITTLVHGDREQVVRVLLAHGWTRVSTRGAYTFTKPEFTRVKDFPLARHLQLRALLTRFRPFMDARITKEPLGT